LDVTVQWRMKLYDAGALLEGKIVITGKEFLIVRENTSNKNARASVDSSIIQIQIPIGCPREEDEETVG